MELHGGVEGFAKVMVASYCPWCILIKLPQFYVSVVCQQSWKNMFFLTFLQAFLLGFCR